MTVILWIINIGLALAFLAAGGMKIGKSKAAYVASGMGWAEQVGAGNIKLIGVAEVLGAIGLVLPFALDVAPVLTPVAAVCLALIMLGAVITHLRRRESPAGAAGFGVLSVLSAVLGFIVLL